MIVDLWRRRLESAAKAPVILVAHSGANSLPASLETLARLRQDGRTGRILYLAGPEDEAGLAGVKAAVRDVDVWRQLRQARIGVVGSPSGWLVASSPDPEIVRLRWGPHVVPVSLDQLTEAIRTAAGDAAGSNGESIASGAAEVKEPEPGDVTTAEFVSAAVQHIAAKHGLKGVALRCFDLVEQLGTTGCVALSRLADEGVVAGCEGDIVSTLAMLWVRLLLDEISWMANPSAIDTAGNSLTLAHCTVPRSMVDGYTLRSHFESGIGVAIQGALPSGPVTLVRIGGRSMTELWLAEAEIIRGGNADNLCRTQVEVRLVEGMRLRSRGCRSARSGPQHVRPGSTRVSTASHAIYPLVAWQRTGRSQRSSAGAPREWWASRWPQFPLGATCPGTASSTAGARSA
jgi:L-fucose isomerase-like protein